MTGILPSIDHLIVVMLENRSLDNMLGTLYDDVARRRVSCCQLIAGRHSTACSRG